MGQYQPRDNSGTLFRNEKKQSEKHPDYKGDGIINGQEVWLSAWIKEGKRGKFMSLSFEPKKERSNNRSSERKPARANDEDEDVPF